MLRDQEAGSGVKWIRAPDSEARTPYKSLQSRPSAAPAPVDAACACLLVVRLPCLCLCFRAPRHKCPGTGAPSLYDLAATTLPPGLCALGRLEPLNRSLIKVRFFANRSAPRRCAGELRGQEADSAEDSVRHLAWTPDRSENRAERIVLGASFGGCCLRLLACLLA